VQEVEGG
jgi:hypothetical protein